MYSIQTFIVLVLLSCQSSAVPTKPQCDAGAANPWLQDLYGYAPALAYCSASYPLAPVTAIVTDYKTKTIFAETAIYSKTVPYTLAPLSKTTSVGFTLTHTATTTDWSKKVSTW